MAKRDYAREREQVEHDALLLTQHRKHLHETAMDELQQLTWTIDLLRSVCGCDGHEEEAAMWAAVLLNLRGLESSLGGIKNHLEVKE